MFRLVAVRAGPSLLGRRHPARIGSDVLHRRVDAEGRRLRIQQTQINTAIETDVRNALQFVQSARARWDAAGVARRSAEEQYASEQRQFQAGTSSTFLVLQRQTDMINARNRETRAQSDYAESLANLDRATAHTIEARGITVQ